MKKVSAEFCKAERLYERVNYLSGIGLSVCYYAANNGLYRIVIFK